VAGALAALTGACDGGKTEYMGAHAPFAGCDGSPTAPPAALGLAPFYAKYLDGYGTPVLSSAKVSDEALLRACRITGEMVAARADVRQTLAAAHLRVAVVATSEHSTDIPEYADLYSAFPGTDWDSLRGLSATRARPVASAGEENLMCLPGDIYTGDSVLVWMLAHALRDLAIGDVDPQFPARLQSAYTSAMDNGLWANTNATADPGAYFAQGAQVWYSASAAGPANTRAELWTYDPTLATLVADFLPADDWKASCY
jgi:hypothetical protein